jgi:acetolactate synthase-1/2/3 large subunit
VAQAGRPGPVLVDIPRDVFQARTEFSYPEKVDLPGFKPKLFGHPSQVKKASDLVNSAERPVIVAGHGINISKAFTELRELAENAQIPVVTTFLGIGCFPESHVLSYGWLGMHGMGYANKAVHNSDLLLAVGMRFDDRATGGVSTFAPNARVVHIDVDAAEIGKNIPVDVPIVGDLKNVLQVLNKQISRREHVAWLSQLDEWRSLHPATEIRNHEDILPQYIIRQIHEATKGETIIVTGVGQAQMWAAQYFFYDRPNSFVSSGGLGTMGFELPGAIGAKVGCPQETVWCIAGDGGFQMTVQELATMVQEDLDINIAVFNNGWLGMVRQWQELIYNKRYFGTQLYNPDFVKLAEAYGIKGVKVSKKTDVRPAIHRAMEHKGPFLIEFMVEPEENVYPFVPPGKTIVEFLELPDPATSLKK